MTIRHVRREEALPGKETRPLNQAAIRLSSRDVRPFTGREMRHVMCAVNGQGGHLCIDRAPASPARAAGVAVRSNGDHLAAPTSGGGTMRVTVDDRVAAGYTTVATKTEAAFTAPRAGAFDQIATARTVLADGKEPLLGVTQLRSDARLGAA